MKLQYRNSEQTKTNIQESVSNSKSPEVLTNASKKWTMPIKNRMMALNQFAILCDTNLQNWTNGEIVLTQKI